MGGLNSEGGKIRWPFLLSVTWTLRIGSIESR